MAPSKKQVEVADSWEDDIPSEDEVSTTVKDEAQQSLDDNNKDEESLPAPKRNEPEFEDPHNYYNRREDASRSDIPEKRPEKSTAAISRIIASNLGIRNRQTAEQRQFHKSQIENEKKRREQEKQKKQEEEKLKQSIWED